MEKDEEMKGSGNSYDFGARLYDPRIGRWLAKDPLEHKYFDLSTYCFVANSPIIFIDPDGKRIRGIKKKRGKNGELRYTKFGEKYVEKYVGARMKTNTGKKEIMAMINDEDVVYTVLLTDDLIVQKGKDGKYHVSEGYSNYDERVLVISTLKFYKDKDEISDEDIANAKTSHYNPGENNLQEGTWSLIDAKITREDIDFNTAANDDSQENKAKTDSQTVKYEMEYKPKSVEEYIHYVGAHEEVHLKSEENAKLFADGDIYKAELEAYENGLKENLEYRKEVNKENVSSQEEKYIKKD